MPGLLRRRRVRVRPLAALPATKPKGETRRWPPQSCAPLRPDCRDDVRATLRVQERPPVARCQGVWRSLLAISKPGGLCRKSQVPEKPETIISRWAFVFLRDAPSCAGLPARVLHVMASLPVRPRKSDANARTIRARQLRTRRTKSLQESAGALALDLRNL